MSRTPIHPMSAILLIVVDGLWAVVDWVALSWIVTIPLSFLAVFVPSLFIQKYLNDDSAGKATGIAGFLGVLAAVPTPITGTTAGIAALSYAGFRFLKTRWSR